MAVNVHENIMFLSFAADGKETRHFAVDLSRGIDELDHKWGYAGDWMYFKAGAYNQCSTRNAPGVWYAACEGTGDWDTDKANGDYAQVTFTRLVTGKSTAPE